jgi:hypothetical protein
MERTGEARPVKDALLWVSFAVFIAGTLRAAYIAAFGESLDRVASISRLVAVILGVAAVVLWRVARQR